MRLLDRLFGDVRSCRRRFDGSKRHTFEFNSCIPPFVSVFLEVKLKEDESNCKPRSRDRRDSKELMVTKRCNVEFLRVPGLFLQIPDGKDSVL